MDGPPFAQRRPGCPGAAIILAALEDAGERDPRRAARRRLSSCRRREDASHRTSGRWKVGEGTMQRREFLTKGAVALGAVAAAPVVGARAARAAAGGMFGGVDRGLLGLVGCDHVGMTVPDINQAIEWYEDVIGAVAPLTFGPFPAGPFVASVVDVAGPPRSTRSRCCASATAPASSCSSTRADGQRQDMPKTRTGPATTSPSTSPTSTRRSSTWIEKGVRRMPAGPFTLTQGRRRGRRSSTSRPPGAATSSSSATRTGWRTRRRA